MNNTLFKDVEIESSSLGQIYLIVIADYVLFEVLLYVLLDKPLNIRQMQIQKNMKSKSSSESKHSPESNNLNKFSEYI